MKKGYDASPSSKRGSNEDGLEKNTVSSSKRADSEDGLLKNTVYLLSHIPVKG
jgi:hypothetical protein